MICILQQMVIKRKTTTEEEMSCSMGGEVWLSIRNTMVEILNDPPPSEHAVIPHDYGREIQTLKETVASLIAEIEMLKEDRDETPGRKRFRL